MKTITAGFCLHIMLDQNGMHPPEHTTATKKRLLHVKKRKIHPNYKVLRYSSLHTKFPHWGAADAEIKVPSGENTGLKRSPL